MRNLIHVICYILLIVVYYLHLLDILAAKIISIFIHITQVHTQFAHIKKQVISNQQDKIKFILLYALLFDVSTNSFIISCFCGLWSYLFNNTQTTFVFERNQKMTYIMMVWCTEWKYILFFWVKIYSFSFYVIEQFRFMNDLKCYV